MKHYILRTLIIILVCAPVFLLIRRPWKSGDRKDVVRVVYDVYMTCLLILVFEGDYGTPAEMINSFRERLATGEAISLTPFQTITGFLDWGSTDDIWINIISNFVIFIPIGFLLPCLRKEFRQIWAIAPVCFGLPVFIEFFQLFIGRHTDIDDVMLNFLGGMFGWIIYNIADKIIKTVKSRHNNQ